MHWLFGTLVYLDAKLPRPGCVCVGGGGWGGDVRKGKMGARKEKGKTGASLGEWEGGDGGRADIGVGKKIPTVRDPF